ERCARRRSAPQTVWSQTPGSPSPAPTRAAEPAASPGAPAGIGKRQSLRAPALAAITMHPTGGGLAVVARMLWQAFRDQWGERARCFEMFAERNHPATSSEKLRFALS